MNIILSDKCNNIVAICCLMIRSFLKCFTVKRMSLKIKIHDNSFLLAMSGRKIQNLSKGKCIHALR